LHFQKAQEEMQHQTFESENVYAFLPAVLDDPSAVLLDQSVDATPLAFLSKDSLDFSQLPHRPPHHPARLQTEPIKNYRGQRAGTKEDRAQAQAQSKHNPEW
jgi:hypothetical protein